MYQKDLIRSVWKSAGLYDEKDSKLQQFLKLLDDPNQCWKEMTDTCRRSFASYKAKLVQPILDSADKLSHLILIRSASESNDDEMALIKGYIASSDPKRDQTELRAVALRNIPHLTSALMQKPNLTQEVRDTIAALAPPTPPPAPTPPASTPASTAPVQPKAAS
jgi:hypothetical protein